MTHECNCPYCTSKGQRTAIVSGKSVYQVKIEEFTNLINSRPIGRSRFEIRILDAQQRLQSDMREMTSEERAQFMAEIMAYCEDRFVAEFGKALEAKRK